MACACPGGGARGIGEGVSGCGDQPGSSLFRAWPAYQRRCPAHGKATGNGSIRVPI